MSIYVSRFTYTYQDPLTSSSSLINIDQLPFKYTNQIELINISSLQTSFQTIIKLFLTNMLSLLLLSMDIVKHYIQCYVHKFDYHRHTHDSELT